MDVLKRFAAKLAAGQVAGLTRSMVPKAPKSFDDLSRLCGIFSELELFMWLQRKFPPGNVMEQQTAQSLKEQAIHMIAHGLSAVCLSGRSRSVVLVKSKPHIRFIAFGTPSRSSPCMMYGNARRTNSSSITATYPVIDLSVRNGAILNQSKKNGMMKTKTRTGTMAWQTYDSANASLAQLYSHKILRLTGTLVRC
jgi:hypothetical protein